MKENFENEIANGTGANYANKLEERMLEKAAADKSNEESKQEGSQPDIIDANAQEVAADSASTSEAKMTLKYNVRAHFDSVRGVHCLKQHNTLATISEDFKIKLWNI